MRKYFWAAALSTIFGASMAWAVDWYQATGTPAANSALSSASMRAEFALIQAATDKLPALTGNANKVITVNAGGTALQATSLATAIQGVDGAGSGIDADLLDGIDSTGYARLGSSNTFTTVGVPITLSLNGGPALRMTDTGQGVDGKSWAIRIGAATFSIQTENDALSPVRSPLQINRNGTTATSIALSSDALTWNRLDGAGAFNVGYLEVPQNIQAANYTLIATDTGKHIYHASGAGAGDTYTIPSNASVAYPIGTSLTFINSDSNAVSIAITTDTMTLAGTTSTGTRTLAQNGIATAIKVTATAWIISGSGLT